MNRETWGGGIVIVEKANPTSPSAGNHSCEFMTSMSFAALGPVLRLAYTSHSLFCNVPWGFHGMKAFFKMDS